MESACIGLAALIISMGAAIMAVDPLLQMIYGRPKIYIEFIRSPSESSCTLWYYLYNLPIRSNLLDRLGIYRRTAEDVFITFSIWDENNKRWIGEKANAAIRLNGEEDRRISLSSSGAPARCRIVEATTKGGAVVIGRKENTTYSPPLKASNYRVDITVAYAGGRIKLQKGFSVGKTPADLHWLK